MGTVQTVGTLIDQVLVGQDEYTRHNIKPYDQGRKKVARVKTKRQLSNRDFVWMVYKVAHEMYDVLSTPENISKLNIDQPPATPSQASKYFSIVDAPESKMVVVGQKIHKLVTLVDAGEIPAQKISNDAARNARIFIKRYYKLIDDLLQEKASSGWLMPHVITDGTGDVAFEWWANDKVLSIFVYEDNYIEYLQAWGPDISQEMDEGENPSDEILKELWVWLSS